MYVNKHLSVNHCINTCIHELYLQEYDESFADVFVVDLRLQQPVVDVSDHPLVRKSTSDVCMYVCMHVCMHACMYI